MKSTVLFTLTFMASVAAMACPKGLREFNKTIGGDKVCVLEGDYHEDLTLSADYRYVILGAVFMGIEKRKENAQGALVLTQPIDPMVFTINAGVKIYGLNPNKDKTGFWDGFTMKPEPGKKPKPVEGDLKPYISVTRDSIIIVKGTENAPVLMTSAQGAHQATPTHPKEPGNWGGLIINGKAKSNKCSEFTGCTLPGEVETGYYGGDDDDHGDGTIIQYLQVEYGGDRLNGEKELNGVTFNGVGLGAVVNNIAVLYNSDDCVEFFGGAMVVKNVFCYKGEDDGIDTTDGARVLIQNGVVVAADYPNAGADNDRHMIEADSARKEFVSDRLQSDPVLVNFTFVGGVNTLGFLFRRSTNYSLYNSVMYGVDTWCLKLDGHDTLTLNTNVFADCKAGDLITNYTVNTDFVTASSLMFNTAEDKKWVPQPGSPLLAGAQELGEEGDFSTDEDLDEAFSAKYDETAKYRGAMGSKDWTSWIKIK